MNLLLFIERFMLLLFRLGVLVARQNKTTSLSLAFD